MSYPGGLGLLLCLGVVVHQFLESLLATWLHQQQSLPDKRLRHILAVIRVEQRYAVARPLVFHVHQALLVQDVVEQGIDSFTLRILLKTQPQYTVNSLQSPNIDPPHVKLNCRILLLFIFSVLFSYAYACFQVSAWYNRQDLILADILQHASVVNR